MALCSLLDPLCCQEDHWDVVHEQQQEHHPKSQTLSIHRELVINEDEEEEEQWAEVLLSLLSRQDETRLRANDGDGDGGSYVGAARGEAVEWAARASAWHGFDAPTVVLAVHCLDRCFLSPDERALRLHDDKPWMARLAATACLSLAAKVEETHVPPLLDIQLAAAPPEQARYLFEPKTLMRMELLVLSALGWRLSPVTPLSFIHHLIPKLLSSTEKHNTGQLLLRCHAVLLSLIADWRWIRYQPSEWAVATLLHAMSNSGIDSFNYKETHNYLSGLLNTPKEIVEECYQIILAAMAGGTVGNKRKHFSSSYCYSSPTSPNGVIGSCFSCESLLSGGEPMRPLSVSSSPEHPPHKKSSCIAANTVSSGEDGGIV